MERIKWIKNQMPKSDDKHLSILALDEVKKAKSFHESFPQYCETPLAHLENLAAYLGISDIFVKDESYRFGLNAFKVLGGSYAIARYIARETGKDVSELDYATLTSEELNKEFGQATFFTATDGNHGRGVAWAANKLGQKAVVYMPKGTTKARLENIQKEKAIVTIEELNFDECVRLAVAESAKTTQGIVVQDTAWNGYEDIPAWIMQGYSTMVLEADAQMHQAGIDRPTHVFIQAGVGSLAGTVQGYFVNKYPGNPPVVVTVEANAADCLYKSAVEKDGKIRCVEGEMQTIMAGLACGEPNILAWDILMNHTAVFVSCPDWVTTRGMRISAAPLKGDLPIVSGESGAVGLGLLATIMKDDSYRDLRDAIGLDSDSKVLLFSTEGDTDPERYKNIVWECKEE
ncbi:MAG: diaminopropionate ammonia-lyase [Bacillota bacterium]|nr:diaminopropionate ammonia-lyase [Bacillota bacterium]MDW7678499.1 diaminopropionate ammonia-lyase [Bacillota bacterium]